MAETERGAQGKYKVVNVEQIMMRHEMRFAVV